MSSEDTRVFRRRGQTNLPGDEAQVRLGFGIWVPIQGYIGFMKGYMAQQGKTHERNMGNEVETGLWATNTKACASGEVTESHLSLKKLTPTNPSTARLSLPCAKSRRGQYAKCSHIPRSLSKTLCACLFAALLHSVAVTCPLLPNAQLPPACHLRKPPSNFGFSVSG